MAMGEDQELFECEVLWPEASHDDDDDEHAIASGCSSSSSCVSVATRRRGGGGVPVPDKQRHPGCSSLPVDIPKPARSTWRQDDDDEDGGHGGSMVPPHVLVSRRRSEGAEAAFALRSGPGRARELSYLRDSVLRMTGFIEG